MRRLILRIMDWDITWFGIGWLRPRPQDPISGGTALTIVALTGIFALAAGPVVYLLLSHLEPRNESAILLASVAAAMVAFGLNAVLQLLSAVYWNQRAAELRAAN
ncbi:MAG: hypothetical protein K1X57_02185 [Gemmataceae bacterium]|nr:hypothetical protein [Gemmataceae bacterium]